MSCLLFHKMLNQTSSKKNKITNLVNFKITCRKVKHKMVRVVLYVVCVLQKLKAESFHLFAVVIVAMFDVRCLMMLESTLAVFLKNIKTLIMNLTDNGRKNSCLEAACAFAEMKPKMLLFLCED